MQLSIYGSPSSSAGRCFWALEECGATYAHKSIDMKNKEHKTPEFLSLNPNGKIPVLVVEDEGKSFSIWESIAINQFLADTFSPELAGGNNVKDRALITQWNTWGIHDYQTPMIQVFIQNVFVPEARRSQEVIQKNMEKVAAEQTLLDTHLSSHQFIIGDAISIADINVGFVTQINHSLGLSIDDWPNLSAWLKRLEERPAALKLKQLQSN